MRRALAGAALVIGLMAMALSCGDSAESGGMPMEDSGGYGGLGPSGMAATAAPAAASDAAITEAMGLDRAPMGQAAAGMQQQKESAQAGRGGGGADGGAASASGASSTAGASGAGGTAGAAGMSGAGGMAGTASAAGAGGAAGAAGMSGEGGTAGAAGMSGEGGTAGAAGSVQGQGGRQLIVEGWVSLEVNDIDAGARQVETLAAQRGGWVESSDIVGEGGYRTASIGMRVPAERFNNAMETLRGLGRVTDEGVTSSDVTDRLIDNEARLEAWTAQEERLVVLLENAATVEDVIEIEKRIAQVRADIEQVAATQRSLENRVAASLIRVNLHLPARFAADPPRGSLALAVGDPAEAAGAIATQVEALQGYLGEKREYQQDRGQVIELSAFVRATDLAGLMDYAVTLGEPSERRLDSVGPAPAGNTPNARLTLVVRSNVDSAASLSVEASEPMAAAGEIRARAESLGGYVESWNESRWDEGDGVSINMDLVVRGSDLRQIMEFGAGLGKVDRWEYHSVGQGPADAAPNSRLTVSVYSEYGPGVPWIPIGTAIGAVAIAAAAAGFIIVAWRRRRNRAGDDGVAGVSRPQSLARDDGDGGDGAGSGSPGATG